MSNRASLGKVAEAREMYAVAGRHVVVRETVPAR